MILLNTVATYLWYGMVQVLFKRKSHFKQIKYIIIDDKFDCEEASNWNQTHPQAY